MGGTVTTLHFDTALTPAGWASDVRVGIREGRISSIESGARPQPSDERHRVALPGVPNLHSHAFQRGLAGLSERRGPAHDSFWTWRERMYDFVTDLGPEDLRAIATMAYVEMLEAGFTRVAEFHYLHHGPDGTEYSNPAEMSAAIAAAAASSGIGLTLLPVYYAQAGFGRAASSQQARFACEMSGFARLFEAAGALARYLPDMVLGVAPHSLRAVRNEQLSPVAAMAGTGPVHIHAAEQEQEVQDCIAALGARPVEWLLDHQTIDSRWCLVHATHMNDEEASALARSGAVAGLCPITEANLGDGLFNLAPFAKNDGQWGVGSDSNVLINAAEELRLLEYGQRLQERRRAVFAAGPGHSTGEDLFQAAVNGGGQAVGVSSGLIPGASADLLSLDISHPSLTGMTRGDLLDRVIFAGGTAAIDCVWRYGRKIVEKGRHLDREAVEGAYRATMTRMLAR